MAGVGLSELQVASRILQWNGIYRRNRELNCFTHLMGSAENLSEYDRAKSLQPLTGRSVAIKDNIVTQDLPTTCGSKLLKSFSSPFDATVVRLVRKYGGAVRGKTNLDEFGMGSYSINSNSGPVKGKKIADGRILAAGGSSGGSAVSVANTLAAIGIGTDTGGSVRLPAAYNSIVGFKPSYGMISRWGVVAYANSMDTVGIMSRDVELVRMLYDYLNQYDERDPTSLSPGSRSRLEIQTEDRWPPTKSLRIGIPIEYNIKELSPPVRATWLETMKVLERMNHSLHMVSLPTTQQALSAYYILAPAEAASNLAKYDGIRYGSRFPRAEAFVNEDECTASQDPTSSLLFSKTRQSGFGDEVRRRILLGSYSLSAKAIDNYFIQAQKIRRLVQQDFDRVFAIPNITSPTKSAIHAPSGVDIILCPTAPTEPPFLDGLHTQSPLDPYTNDVFTVPASLAGLPAISIPLSKWLNQGKHVIPIGMQLIGQYGDDQMVLALAEQLETKLVTKKVSSTHFADMRMKRLWSTYPVSRN